VVIWDTAGQERFRTLTSGSYRGVQGVLVVYAINDPTSFQNCTQWLAEVKRYAQNPDVIRILVGNKTDSGEQTVAADAAKAFATSNGMSFFETSAKTNTNVQQAFETLINMIFEKEVPVVIEPTKSQGCKCVLL
jgi:Ras-related protein Rab-1A